MHREPGDIDRYCERRSLKGAEELGEGLAVEIKVAAALAEERAVHPDFFERR
jgi:hypothetical protein